MSESEGKRLTPADSAWLRMELPENLMTITGVMKLKDRLPYDRFCRMLEKRLLIHERFRQRVVPAERTLGRPRWVEKDFSLSDHVIPVELPEGAGKKELENYVSERMSEPLDPDLPLWQFYYVEDFLGGSALVARIHHCIGDGIALMKVMLDMADPIEDDSVPRVGHPRSVRDHHRALVNPGRKVLEAVRNGGSAVQALGHLLFLRRDPRTRLKGDLTVRKRAVWSDQIPLERIKGIGRRLDATINDVLLTVASGAIRGYLSRHQEVPDDLRVRAVVPVNIRPPEDTVLENRFGLVFLTLPVGVADPRERLRELKEDMDRLKRSPEAFVAYGLLRLFGRTNAWIQGKIVKILSKNASAVMTNVPGPRGPISYAGSEIEHFMFWVPQSGRLAMGLSILSYNQRVRVGIATDEGLVPDPAGLIDEFHLALDELEAVASR